MAAVCRFGVGMPLTAAESAVRNATAAVFVLYSIFLHDCCDYFLFSEKLNICAEAGVLVDSERYSHPVKLPCSSPQWILPI